MRRGDESRGDAATRIFRGDGDDAAARDADIPRRRGRRRGRWRGSLRGDEVARRTPRARSQVAFLCDHAVAEGVAPAVFVGCQLAVVRRIHAAADAAADATADVLAEAVAGALKRANVPRAAPLTAPRRAYEAAARVKYARRIEKKGRPRGPGEAAARDKARTAVASHEGNPDDPPSEDALADFAGWEGEVPTFHTQRTLRQSTLDDLRRIVRRADFMMQGCRRDLAFAYADELAAWHGYDAPSPADDGSTSVGARIRPPVQASIAVQDANGRRSSHVENTSGTGVERGVVEQALALAPSGAVIRELLELVQDCLLCALVTVGPLGARDALREFFDHERAHEPKAGADACRTRDAWVLWAGKRVPDLERALLDLSAPPESVLAEMMAAEKAGARTNKGARRRSSGVVQRASLLGRDSLLGRNSLLMVAAGPSALSPPSQPRRSNLKDLVDNEVTATHKHHHVHRAWLSETWLRAISASDPYEDARRRVADATRASRKVVLESLRGHGPMLAQHATLLAWTARAGPGLRIAAGLSDSSKHREATVDEAVRMFVDLWPPDLQFGRSDAMKRVEREHPELRSELLRNLQYLVMAIHGQGARAASLRDVQKLSSTICVAPAAARDALGGAARDARDLLAAALPALFSARCIDLAERFAVANDKIATFSATLDAFFDQISFLRDLNASWETLERAFEEAIALHDFLRAQGMKSTRDARTKKATFVGVVAKLAAKSGAGELGRLARRLAADEALYTGQEKVARGKLRRGPAR